jgi:hypothetical protein
VHGDANGARLVRDRARHRLPDPPGCVGRELVALAIVELLDGTDQAKGAFLDQIEEAEAATKVGLRDRDDEPEVGLDHLGLRRHVTALDALCEVDLLVGGEKRDFADLAQVEAQRVQRRLDAEIELRAFLLFRCGLLVRRMLVRLAFQQLDAVVDQIRVEVFDLLFGELDVLEPGCDLVVVENAFLQTFLNELLQLLDLRKGDFDGEQRRPTSRLIFALVDGVSIYERKRAGYPHPPGSPSRGPDITEVPAKANSDFFSEVLVR